PPHSHPPRGVAHRYTMLRASLRPLRRLCPPRPPGLLLPSRTFKAGHPLPSELGVASAGSHAGAGKALNAAGQALRDAMHSREELRQTFMQALEARSRRLALASISVIGVCGLIFYSNRQHAKERVVEQISDVATLTLGDQKMQAQAQIATMQTLQALLEDEATVSRSVKFLSAVADHAETRRALVTLLVDALKNPAVLNEALQLTLWVLDDESCREHLVGALLSALHSKGFLDGAGYFATQWLERTDVRDAVTDCLKDASTRVLEDDDVRNFAATFVMDLVQQPELQVKTSEHLWAAFRGLVIPPKRTKSAEEERRPRTPSSRLATTASPDSSSNLASTQAAQKPEAVAASSASAQHHSGTELEAVSRELTPLSTPPAGIDGNRPPDATTSDERIPADSDDDTGGSAAVTPLHGGPCLSTTSVGVSPMNQVNEKSNACFSSSNAPVVSEACSSAPLNSDGRCETSNGVSGTPAASDGGANSSQGDSNGMGFSGSSNAPSAPLSAPAPSIASTKGANSPPAAANVSLSILASSSYGVAAHPSMIVSSAGLNASASSNCDSSGPAAVSTQMYAAGSDTASRTSAPSSVDGRAPSFDEVSPSSSLTLDGGSQMLTSSPNLRVPSPSESFNSVLASSTKPPDLALHSSAADQTDRNDSGTGAARLTPLHYELRVDVSFDPEWGDVPSTGELTGATSALQRSDTKINALPLETVLLSGNAEAAASAFTISDYYQYPWGEPTSSPVSYMPDSNNSTPSETAPTSAVTMKLASLSSPPDEEVVEGALNALQSSKEGSLTSSLTVVSEETQYSLSSSPVAWQPVSATTVERPNDADGHALLMVEQGESPSFALTSEQHYDHMPAAGRQLRYPKALTTTHASLLATIYNLQVGAEDGASTSRDSENADRMPPSSANADRLLPSSENACRRETEGSLIANSASLQDEKESELATLICIQPATCSRELHAEHTGNSGAQPETPAVVGAMEHGNVKSSSGTGLFLRLFGY
ncbi:MAG: hypothetical protein SGPRY_010586, partial [Prymnesium sp.]